MEQSDPSACWGAGWSERMGIQMTDAKGAHQIRINPDLFISYRRTDRDDFRPRANTGTGRSRSVYAAAAFSTRLGPVGPATTSS